MHVRILGPLGVETDTGVVTLGGLKQRTILAVLALHHGEVVSPDVLIEAAWGDQLPANPANTLQYQIAQLRKLLESTPSSPTRLMSRSQGYVLDSNTTTLDADEFSDTVRGARTAYNAGDLVRAKDRIEEALALWRGPALGDFRYDEFAHADATRMDEERLAAEELQLDIALADGRHTEVIPALSQLTIQHPERESLWSRRMTALYRDGNQTDALRVYQQASDALAEVGIEPSAELRVLEQKILDQDPELSPTTIRTQRTQRSGNVPAPSNRLIGRSKEVEAVSELLASGRLATLIGPGGAGKTRLAIEVARSTEALYTDGAWLIRLDQLTNPDLLTSQVGQALGVRENPEVPIFDNLVSLLTDRNILIVLDNCEHLIDAVAAFAFEFLERCDGARVLATSQATLDLPGESVFEVQPLTVPGQSDSIYDRLDDVAAVTLFLERATPAGRSTRDWSDADLVTVSNIVTALDGVPLAVELAAARTRSMSLEEIAQGLSDPTALLTTGTRTAPPRQRSLGAVIEWSLSLLEPHQRTNLINLAVFVGGFDTEAAASVIGKPVGETRMLLARFVDRSLLSRMNDVEGGSRFRMLETLRRYCIGQLTADQLADARDAHLATYDTFMEAAASGLLGENQLSWLARLDAEYKNIRTGLEWSLDGGSLASGLRIGENLGRWWDWRGLLKEATEWLGRLADATTDPLPSLPAVLAWSAFLFWEFDDVDQASTAITRAEEAAQVLGGPEERGITFAVRSLIARSQGDLEQARGDCESMIGLGESYADGWATAWAHSALATIAMAAGDLDASAKEAQQAIDMFRERGDLRGVGWGLTSAAQVSLALGDLDRAQRLSTDALTASTTTMDHRNISWVLELLAEIAAGVGDDERAAVLWGAAHPFLRQRGLTSPASKRTEPEALETELRNRLEDRFSELFNVGSSDPDTVISQALTTRRV